MISFSQGVGPYEKGLSRKYTTFLSSIFGIPQAADVFTTSIQVLFNAYFN